MDPQQLQRYIDFISHYLRQREGEAQMGTQTEMGPRTMQLLGNPQPTMSYPSGYSNYGQDAMNVQMELIKALQALKQR